MDAFKASEIERMRQGGNAGWRAFFEDHEDTQMRGMSWEGATIAERYGGEVGEEWKERLGCKVEGREYVPGERKAAVSTSTNTNASTNPNNNNNNNNTAKGSGGGGVQRSGSARGGSVASGNGSLSSEGIAGPSGGSVGGGGGAGGGKVKVDDRYFSKLGAENASRSEALPPSQGGKYAGFGNTPGPETSTGQGEIPNLEDLQRDPVAALTKGFGWFASTLSKTAKTVNDGYIQPTAKQVCPIPRPPQVSPFLNIFPHTSSFFFSQSVVGAEHLFRCPISDSSSCFLILVSEYHGVFPLKIMPTLD